MAKIGGLGGAPSDLKDLGKSTPAQIENQVREAFDKLGKDLGEPRVFPGLKLQQLPSFKLSKGDEIPLKTAYVLEGSGKFVVMQRYPLPSRPTLHGKFDYAPKEAAGVGDTSDNFSKMPVEPEMKHATGLAQPLPDGLATGISPLAN